MIRALSTLYTAGLILLVGATCAAYIVIFMGFIEACNRVPWACR